MFCCTDIVKSFFTWFRMRRRIPERLSKETPGTSDAQVNQKASRASGVPPAFPPVLQVFLLLVPLRLVFASTMPIMDCDGCISFIPSSPQIIHGLLCPKPRNLQLLGAATLLVLWKGHSNVGIFSGVCAPILSLLAAALSIGKPRSVSHMRICQFRILTGRLPRQVWSTACFLGHIPERKL